MTNSATLSQRALSMTSTGSTSSSMPHRPTKHGALGDAPGVTQAMTVNCLLLADGDCIDSAGASRAGTTSTLFGHELRTLSTLAVFLCSLLGPRP